jgi:hypothetical protein
MDIYIPALRPRTSRARSKDCQRVPPNEQCKHASTSVDSGAEPNLKSSSSTKSPVLLFVHGGVWATGSKWHYALMATRLAQAGIVACVMEYTLYPQANADRMVNSPSSARIFFVERLCRTCSTSGPSKGVMALRLSRCARQAYSGRACWPANDALRCLRRSKK